MYIINVSIHSKNGQSKTEIKKAISFAIALSRINYLELNAIKETQNTYSENR